MRGCDRAVENLSVPDFHCCIFYKWLVITKLQTLLKHYLSLSPLKSGSHGCINLQTMRQFSLSKEAVRVGATNENQWSAGAAKAFSPTLSLSLSFSFPSDISFHYISHLENLFAGNVNEKLES